MFYDPVGPLGCGIGGGGLSVDCEPHFVGDPRVYHVRGDHLVREDAGTVVFDVPLAAPAGATSFVLALVMERSELHIGAVLDGDVVVLRRSSEDGTTIADYRIATAGTPATRVQLDEGADTIVVRALAERPWSAILDARDGTLVDRAEIGVPLTAFAPDAPDRVWSRAAGAATLGAITARRDHIRSTGEHAWGFHLDDPFSCGAYALAEVGDELAVLHHCPGTSGATMTFLARSTGTLVETVVAGTIGTIGHSRYRSDVDLAFTPPHLFVRGDESGGSYVCIVDPSSHHTIGCSIQRR
jgi:hypothetical protein